METLESIARALEAGTLPTILPPDAPLQHMIAVALDSRASEMILHGQAVSSGECGAAGRVRLYDAAGAFIGIGESDGTGMVRPKRLFNDAQ
jgi:tRNA U55 pseudouridine synthase TruB